MFMKNIVNSLLNNLIFAIKWLYQKTTDISKIHTYSYTTSENLSKLSLILVLLQLADLIQNFDSMKNFPNRLFDGIHHLL